MKTPEWDKEQKEHEEAENIHRSIYISTSTPTASNGKDGDIWIVYK